GRLERAVHAGARGDPCTRRIDRQLQADDPRALPQHLSVLLEASRARVAEGPVAARVGGAPGSGPPHVVEAPGRMTRDSVATAGIAGQDEVRVQLPFLRRAVRHDL